MRDLYNKASIKCSVVTTHIYSTSFSLGIKMLNAKLRNHIYAIYGLVRFADEIVDTFHDYDKLQLLNEFKNETYKAIENKISLNPILNSFQLTVNQFDIKKELVEAFFVSMELDLTKKTYNQQEYEKYIYGSAEVVGLMCLQIFCSGNSQLYDKLEFNAKKLGAAFQKINFLRDINNDFEGMGRMYFPNVTFNDFTENTKHLIVKDIELDFNEGLIGIKKLPKSSRFGVYIAYMYYKSLLNKIKTTKASKLLKSRIRVPNIIKMLILFTSYFKHKLNLI